MATCPTMKVERDGEIITINEEDFNEETDEKVESEKSLDSMTKAELLAEAEVRGVEVASSLTKAEILETLRT